MLEAVMNRTGVLKSEQMGAAFSLLRSRDLLWTPAVNAYLRGKRETPNDLMAWNADGTRMPCRMHSEYLRQLYLNNALARGEVPAEGGASILPPFTYPCSSSARKPITSRRGSRSTRRAA
jgi:polyhydroxyalkanoate synthase